MPRNLATPDRAYLQCKGRGSAEPRFFEGFGSTEAPPSNSVAGVLARSAYVRSC
jgi:hypothetical protein